MIANSWERKCAWTLSQGKFEVLEQTYCIQSWGWSNPGSYPSAISLDIVGTWQGCIVPASIQFDSLCLIKVLVSPYPETSNDFLTKYPWSRKDAGYCSLRCISVIAASGMCCVSSWNIKWTGERPSAHPCLMGNSHTSSRKDLESPNHDFRTEMAMFVFVCSRVLHGSLCLGRIGYGSIYQNCWAESA